MSDSADPTDHFRTTCPHTGEFFIDRHCWPGLMAVVLGVASLMGGVAAAAYRHHGWMLTLAVAGAAAIAAGLAWLALEHRRVMEIESRWPAKHSAGRPGIL